MTGDPERKERKYGAETVFRQIMDKHFPILVKSMLPSRGRKGGREGGRNLHTKEHDSDTDKIQRQKKNFQSGQKELLVRTRWHR